MSRTTNRNSQSYSGISLRRTAPRDENARVFGPAEAPVVAVRGRHRFRLLIKSLRDFDLSAYLREWLVQAPRPRGSAQLDVDPQSFF
jgi:primosomal protein N' (replication factor Y)